MAKQLIHIGTSGWSYEHWNKAFYPEGLPQQQHLAFYSQNFSIVELNTTFYHLPKPAVVKNWAEQTPQDFLFAVKASRYITHTKRLLDCKESLQRLLKSIKNLDGKIGPVLFQLPPSFQKDSERLESFLKLLPKKILVTFEFRHDSWFVQEIYDLMKQYKIALCISHLKGKLSPIEITTKFVYIRLHGPYRAYRDSYSEEQLLEWEKHIISWKKKKIATYCFFDNDQKGYAALNALQLQKMLRRSL